MQITNIVYNLNVQNSVLLVYNSIRHYSLATDVYLQIRINEQYSL